MLYQDTLTGSCTRYPIARYTVGVSAKIRTALARARSFTTVWATRSGCGPFSNIAKSIGGLVYKALPLASSFIPGGSIISTAIPAIAAGMGPGGAAPQPAAPA